MVSKSAVKKAESKVSSNAATKRSTKSAVSRSKGTEHDQEKDEETGQRPWLMDLVYEHALNTGANIVELTERLGYSEGYLFHLKARPYKCSRLGMETVRKLAEFLGISPIAVQVAAGILKPSDFFSVSDEAKIRAELVRTARYIADDDRWSIFVPRPVEQLETRVLMLIVHSYQLATGRQMMKIHVPSDAIEEGAKLAVSGAPKLKKKK